MSGAGKRGSNMMCSVHRNLVPLVQNVFLYLLGSKIITITFTVLQKTARDIESALHTVFIEHFSKSDILNHSVIIAERDRLLLSSGKC